MAKGKKVVKSKAKPKSKSSDKKQSKPADLSKFSNQLRLLGLKIIHVTGDGNCLFRSIADQLEGNEEEHLKYRRMVVEYMMEHREDFEPFVEDDEPFDTYCDNMQEDGTWGGNMELQAASLVTRTNICIHRHLASRFLIQNFTGVRTLHLSYHDGEHYNSVRLETDDCTGPAKPILLEDSSNQASSMQSKCPEEYDQALIKLIINGTGCTDVSKIEQVLKDVYGDVDSAIEYIIAEQNAIQFPAENVDYLAVPEDLDYSHNILSNTNSAVPSEKVEQPMSESKKILHKSKSNNNNSAIPSINAEQPTSKAKEILQESKSNTNVESSLKNQVSNKKAARNKPCPCGSNKKNKACCENIVPKSNTKTSSQTDVSNNGKKQRHRGNAPGDDSKSLNSSLGTLHI